MASLFDQNQELFEIILNGLADSILVVDHSQKIVFANKALSELFSLRRTAVGRDIVEVVLNHRICEIIDESITTHQAVDEEVTLTVDRGAERRTVVLNVDAEPVAEDLEKRYVRVILRDETDRVQTEQVRRDFVANASHELRTPLSIINGYIENLRDGAVADTALAQRFLRIMKKHGDRIARIVEDMLTISKFESATQDPTEAGAFDLQSCATDVIERLHPLVEEREAEISISTLDSEALIAGDRLYWDQIFFNLIENALKQNLAKGIKVQVSFQKKGEGYQIIVTDDGVGIPSADLPFIFKRFYRVEKHHGKEIKGTGLGLSIVKRAIEAHGGTVTARSEPGRETAFIIYVPKGDVRRLIEPESDFGDSTGEGGGHEASEARASAPFSA